MKTIVKKSYWKFLFKSTNQHGVHSPFVYNLTTLCFYKKNYQCNFKLKGQIPFNFRKKHIKILNEFLNYLNITEVLPLTSKEHFIFDLPNFKNRTKTLTSKTDLVYLSQDYDLKPYKNSIFSQLNNKGLIIVENPHYNKENWIRLKRNPKSQVIIDTYYFGFIFLRKEQAKEEFYIRL